MHADTDGGQIVGNTNRSVLTVEQQGEMTEWEGDSKNTRRWRRVHWKWMTQVEGKKNPVWSKQSDLVQINTGGNEASNSCVYLSWINKSSSSTSASLTREVIKRSGDIFGWVAVRCVADHQTGFAHRSVAEQDALQQPLLRLPWPCGLRFVRGHRRGHGPSVIHAEWRWHSLSQHLSALSSTGRGSTHHGTRCQLFFYCNFAKWLRSRAGVVRKTASLLSSCALSNPEL